MISVRVRDKTDHRFDKVIKPTVSTGVSTEGCIVKGVAARV